MAEIKKMKITGKLAWKGKIQSGQRGYIGRYDEANWGMRYTFKTGSQYVSSLTLHSYFYNGSKANLNSYPVRVAVSTSASAYLDANGAAGYNGTLRYEVHDSYNVACDISFTDEYLKPNTIYYIFLYPAFKAAFRHYVFTETVSEITAVWATEQAPASTLSAAAGELGNEQELIVSKIDSSYTHTVKYSCGSASGTICTESAETGIAWTPPVSLAAQNTAGETVDIVYEVTTFSGSNVIGTTTTTVQYSIPDNVAPALKAGWATAAPYNVGTAAEHIQAYVQGYSKAQVTFDTSLVDLSGAYGATIKALSITYKGAVITEPYRTPVLSEQGEVSIVCTLTDSRGRAYNKTLTIDVQSYAKPILKDVKIYRSLSNGEANDAGTCVAVQVNAVFSTVAADNMQLQARVKTQGGAFGEYTNLASDSVNVLWEGLISAQSTYVVELSLIDALGNGTVYTGVVPTADVFFNGRTGGKGAAFGKYAETDDLLDVDWNLRVAKTLTVDGDIKIGGKTLKEYIQAVINGE